MIYIYIYVCVYMFVYMYVYMCVCVHKNHLRTYSLLSICLHATLHHFFGLASLSRLPWFTWAPHRPTKVLGAAFRDWSREAQVASRRQLRVNAQEAVRNRQFGVPKGSQGARFAEKESSNLNNWYQLMRFAEWLGFWIVALRLLCSLLLYLTSIGAF